MRVQYCFVMKGVTYRLSGLCFTPLMMRVSSEGADRQSCFPVNTCFKLRTTLWYRAARYTHGIICTLPMRQAHWQHPQVPTKGTP